MTTYLLTEDGGRLLLETSGSILLSDGTFDAAGVSIIATKNVDEIVVLRAASTDLIIVD